MSLCERHYGEGMLKLDGRRPPCIINTWMVPRKYCETSARTEDSKRSGDLTENTKAGISHWIASNMRAICWTFLKAIANSSLCRGPQSQIRKQKLFLLVSEVRSLKKLYKTTSRAENHERVKLSQRSWTCACYRIEIYGHSRETSLLVEALQCPGKSWWGHVASKAVLWSLRLQEPIKEAAV